MAAILELGWTFLVVGLIALTLLIVHVEAGKDFSIPFSAGCTIVAAIMLGFGISFLMVAQGL
ncbi:MAG: hypothetical protein Kow0069_01180 [Promethearchaeota archaeon]